MVIVIMEEKPPVHAAKLRELGAPFKVQSTSWTHAGNMVFIVPTPDDATIMVTETEMVNELTRESVPRIA